MCEPTTIMVGLSIATAAVSTYAQRETAKAQRDAINQQAEHEREEVYESAEEELGQRIKAQRERRARARTAAGESGAMGNSFAAQINQMISDQGMEAALVAKNAAFAQRGVDDRSNTALAGIRSPSALEAGLQIATAGASGYSAGLSLKGRMSAAPKTTGIAAGSMSPIPDTGSPGLTIFGDPKK